MFSRIVSASAALAVLVGFAAPHVVDSQGVQGGDVSTLTSTSAFSCARSNGGWDFIIIRGYAAAAGVDTNVVTNLANAASAGFQYKDVYHVPCAFGTDPAAQIEATITAASGNFGTLWIDVSHGAAGNCAWADPLSNCNFLSSMIRAGAAQNQAMGILTSQYSWNSIMGEGCFVGADNGLPLWYSDFDYNPNYNDFVRFGNWPAPAMKQYWDTVGINCDGLNACADWYQ
jgi:hypothetical protein